MSGKALRDLNALPLSETESESLNKSVLIKPVVDNSNGDPEKVPARNSTLVASSVAKEAEVAPTVTDVGSTEVEYIESENLNDVDDKEKVLQTLLAALDSKDWILVCEALNNVRRLSIFHKESMHDILDQVVSLIVKSMKNPRSALCKTAIMSSEDIFKAYGDLIIDLFDPMLIQLLLKASQDKRFAAERALVAMTNWVSPTLLLPKLQPYLKHKNPRIRAKTSMCFSRSVQKLGTEGIKAFGIDKLIQIAASQLSDQLPESREAARSLLFELHSVYEKSNPSASVEPEPAELSSWELFCQSKLSPLSAQAVLRVTSVAREGLVFGF
ncbi:LOW QUALITY PROTEIN: CLASP N-terminal domain [Dillenia turbinata]|uniref:CLASP N-terminal domain n=1 Tax=Dillenia turbinata TaxID=194707 RepID=A0AAN8UZT4_9MAGN